MCKPGVANTKTGQGHLSVSGPLRGRTSSFDGGFNQDQLNTGSPTVVPEGCPRLTDCSGDRRIKVLKGQG